MTGSESSTGTSRRLSIQKQQRQQQDCKSDADQLKKIIIKKPTISVTDTTGCKVDPSSSSPSKEDVPNKLADTEVVEKKDCSTMATERLQLSPATGAKTHVVGTKVSPYITRQELLHSLRRTTSMGITQTMCSGNSSYIYHTPRHLTRTNFNPKPGLPRSTLTPDSALGKSELALNGDISDDDFCEPEETKSMVDFPTTRRSFERQSQRSRGGREYVKCSLNVDSRHEQVSSTCTCVVAPAS